MPALPGPRTTTCGAVLDVGGAAVPLEKLAEGRRSCPARYPPVREAAPCWSSRPGDIAEIRGVVGRDGGAQRDRQVAVLEEHQDAVAAAAAPLRLVIGQKHPANSRDRVREDQRAGAVVRLAAQPDDTGAAAIGLGQMAALDRRLLELSPGGETGVSTGDRTTRSCSWPPDRDRLRRPAPRGRVRPWRRTRSPPSRPPSPILLAARSTL